jgi:hypothetical protein
MSDRQGDSDLYRIRADGRDLQAIKPDPARDRAPDWSASLERPWAGGWLIGLGIGLIFAVMVLGGLSSGRRPGHKH